ncbi:hypothetical protein T484DRAFT_1758545, partial [Baffinella frigidus]
RATQIYPPTSTVVWTTEDNAQHRGIFSLVDLSYGNGEYTVRASSQYNTYSYAPWKVFGHDVKGGLWGQQMYSYSSGVYNGADSLDGTYTGDWITIKHPAPFVVSEFQFTPRSTNPGWESNRAPGKFKVYGRNNDIDLWTLLYTQSKDPSDIPVDTVYYTTTANAYSEYGLV